MFLLNELVFFSPLVIYAYFRIRKLIAKKLFKNIFTAFFIFLVLGFPVAETMSHRSVSGWAKYFMIAGYYSLPFMLYLVPIVILSDLITGVIRLLKIISRETIRSPRFRIIRLCLLLMIPVVIVTMGAVNYHHLQVKEYSIEVPRKSSEIRQLKIAFAADFHLGEITEDHFMERFVTKVNALNPDIVLIGGDVLEGDRQDEATDKIETQFRQIRSKCGVYAAPGNHEMHGGNRSDFFIKAGIRLLQDTVEKIDGAFYLAGRNDSHSRNRKSIDELLQNTSDDLPVILLDHRPTDFDRVSHSIVDIQLSGHTHHGQLFPVNFITQHKYELSWGYMKKRQTHFFVTSGVQLWGPPVRTVGASEILVINVVFRDNN
jgi:hypothetical protein